jgi:hypothetical protein
MAARIDPASEIEKVSLEIERRQLGCEAQFSAVLKKGGRFSQHPVQMVWSISSEKIYLIEKWHRNQCSWKDKER